MADTYLDDYGNPISLYDDTHDTGYTSLIPDNSDTHDTGYETNPAKYPGAKTEPEPYDDTAYQNMYATQKMPSESTGFDFSKFLNNLKGQFSGLGGKIQDNPLQSLLMAALAARAFTGEWVFLAGLSR